MRPVDRPAQDFRHTIDVSARSSRPAFQQAADPSLTERGCVPSVSDICTPPHVTRRLLSDAPFSEDGDEGSVGEWGEAGISGLRKIRCGRTIAVIPGKRIPKAVVPGHVRRAHAASHIARQQAPLHAGVIGLAALPLATELAAAPHPNPLPACGERGQVVTHHYFARRREGVGLRFGARRRGGCGTAHVEPRWVCCAACSMPTCRGDRRGDVAAKMMGGVGN